MTTVIIMVVVTHWAFSLFTLCCIVDIALGGIIIEGPINITVELNRVAVLKCYVNKSLDDEVHWLMDGQLLFIERQIQQYAISPNDEDRFTILGSSAYEYHLEINKVTLADARLYTCKIQPKNIGAESTEQSGYLTIHRSPVQIYPECRANGVWSVPFTFEVGNEVMFECESDRGIPDVTLTWMENNDKDDMLYINSSLDDSSAASVTRYFRRNLSIEDQGNRLSCESVYASTILGNYTGSCSIGPLNILFPPQSIGIISDGLAVVGLPYLLTCNVSNGNPHTNTFGWTTFPSIPNTRLYTSLNVLGIQSIIDSDDGLNMSCSATNGVGNVIRSNNITLRVVYPPTTIGPTGTTDTPDTVLVPFSIVYILTILLAGLVFLLLIIWIVLYVLIRRRRRSEENWISEDSNDPRISGHRLHSWMEDTSSVKSYRSEPGVSFFIPDSELNALKGHRSQESIHKVPYPAVQSVSLDNADEPRYIALDGSDSYMNYIPKVAVGATAEPLHGYSPVVQRRHHPYNHKDDPRRQTIPFTNIPRTDALSRKRRVSPISGGESCTEDPGKNQRKCESPVMRYKHKRELSGGSGQQVLQMRQTNSSHTTPSNSPLASPSSSPYRRGRRPYAHHVLPDPGQDSDAGVMTNQDARDDQLKSRNSRSTEGYRPTAGSSHENSASNPGTATNGNNSSVRFRLYQEGSNGKFLTDSNAEDNEEYDNDDDDVFVVVDNKEPYDEEHGDTEGNEKEP